MNISHLSPEITMVTGLARVPQKNAALVIAHCEGYNLARDKIKILLFHPVQGELSSRTTTMTSVLDMSLTAFTCKSAHRPYSRSVADITPRSATG